MLVEKVKDAIGSDEPQTPRDQLGVKPADEKISDDDVNVLNGPNDVDVAIRPDVRSNDVKVQICGLSVSFICNCFSREKQ